MTTLTKANKAFREKFFDKALIKYRIFVSSFEDNASATHPILYEYALAQIKHIENIDFKKADNSTNIIITASNSKYFSSLIMLIESIIKTSYDEVDEILVYSFGLKDWQIDLISNISKVTVFTFELNKVTDKRILRFDPQDPATYFFKVYAFHFWRSYSRFSNIEDINILWIDSGIAVQKNLNRIFSIINSEGCFFVDHSDVEFYYKDPQNLVINSLSPVITEETNHYKPLTPTQLLRPYIKANFFGIRTGGRYNYLFKEHLDICLNTEVLFEPRNINDNKKRDYWINNTDIIKEIDKNGIKNSGKYLYGRHEQTVWSYLVARDYIYIYNTIEYNYTVAPGSGSITESNWDKILRPKLENSFNSTQKYIETFIQKHESLLGKKIIIEKTTKEQMIQAYLDIGKEVYLSNPIYTNVGFPHPSKSKDSTVLLHRGSIARTDQYKYSGRILNSYSNIRNDIFILLGNGPSLGDVDLHSLNKYHTFGLNAAYRAYERIGFWPKYFGCFDALVCNDHAVEFKKLIRNSAIEKFFFINFDDDGNPIFPEEDILNSQKFQKYNFKYRTDIEKTQLNIIATSFDPFVDMRTSGTNSIQTGLLLGYRKFILLGVDQNYVEVVDGAARNNNYHKLIMKETPKENPNYWFSDYQVKGDKFNRPNLQGCQIPAWNNLSMTLDELGINVEIYNCSPITTLECFKKGSLDWALKKLMSINADKLPAYQSILHK